MDFKTVENTVLTPRLRLEPFSEEHFDALHAMDSNPDTMRYIGDGSIRSADETAAAIVRVQKRWRDLGYSWWAIRERESGDIVGAACVQNLANQGGAPLEIGWRLNPCAQGKGYATEAGQAAIWFAFEKIGATYLVAVAHPDNHASHRVMERLKMKYVGDEVHYEQPCAVYGLHKVS